ncbi:MAG: hypothetical protein DMG30_20845 [Acidobacteria bacterium]|nr:MAG: hypothetical protein DMG30_20845 [Acidobacteriota bacterium]
MNRRDLILLGTNRKARMVELSCERLYMQFCDSQLDDTRQKLFERLEGELQGVGELRLVDSTWLAREDLGQWLEPLLVSIRSRGGRVKFLRAPASDRTGFPRIVRQKRISK